MATTAKYILAIDQGTTSTKALVIDQDGAIIGTSWPELFGIEATYPQPGWVEFDPDRMLDTVRQSATAAVRNAGIGFTEIAGIGLANQGETVIAFDGASGRTICPAISWQDRRTEHLTERWRSSGMEETISATTGLRLDPYFSAAKLAWILENVGEAHRLQEAGRLRLGTSDAWLLWQLTGGEHFITDVSTASRTMLLELATLQWSPHLAESFGIPIDCLPRVVPNAERIGVTTQAMFGSEIPITGICVDQQAALFGQRALDTGQAKITYGTGCFLLANIGTDSTLRASGLLTSVGWSIGGETTYVFDGGVYSAGSLVDWLCDLGLATDVDEVARLAQEIDPPSQVMLIPALSGLAAPRWSSRARACWLGMDQGTDRRHLIRSALEAIAFRVREVFDAMEESGIRPECVDVDGGLAQSDLLMQIQAALLNVSLRRNSLSECTALGAGYLAGLGCGLWESPQQLPQSMGERVSFEPDATVANAYAAAFERWKRFCSAVVQMGDEGLFFDHESR